LKKGIVGLVILSLLCSTMTFSAVGRETTTFDRVEITDEDKILDESIMIEDDAAGSTTQTTMLGDPEIDISYPEAGYLYLLSIRPIRMNFVGLLGYSVLVNRNIRVEATTEEVHHVEFVATHKLTGWKTSRSDSRYEDGFSCNLDVATSGRYEITAIAYDEGENEIDRASTKVLFIKFGRDDFGIWVNTMYDGVENDPMPLDIGLLDFGSMLNSGEERQFKVTMKHKDDTTVNLGFARKTIEGKAVIESKFNVDTICDTTKVYEIALEVRFPFPILNGEQVTESNNPYFSFEIGYNSQSGPGPGPNKVDTTFYVGRESIDDPRIFKMHIKPNNLESESQVTFFIDWSTVDGDGHEVLYRTFSTKFEPATELIITSIPRELKVSYEFGESAGVKTRITFEAKGGLLDKIKQTFTIDPLPSYMSFDLTIIGMREFIYESDTVYDVTYSLESEPNGELVTFEVEELPERIHAFWGIDLDKLGDLNVSGFAELNLSREVSRLALYFMGNPIPFIELDHFPRKLRFGSFVDILTGKGNITIHRGLEEEREMNFTVKFDEIVVTKSFELKNNFIEFSWDIDLPNGKGNIQIVRDSETEITSTTSIVFNDWAFTKVVTLKNDFVQLSWDINRAERQGSIAFERHATGGPSTISVSIAHDDWIVTDTVELKNTYSEFFWDLPAGGDNYVLLGLNTDGEELFENTLSFVCASIEVSLGLSIAVTDQFYVSWDYESGHISNFEWSGKILRIDGLAISVDIAGDVFSVEGDCELGEDGHFVISVNKDVTINFLGIERERFKLAGYVSFFGDRELELDWYWGDSGHFLITTHGQQIGDELSLEFGYDPAGQHNYQYGIRMTMTGFLNFHIAVRWIGDDRWLEGSWPPSGWDVEWQLLWDGEWYDLPSPF